MGDTAIRIGELAKRAGDSTSALRFYEEAGLLSPTERSEACNRAYAPEAIGRLQFVQRAKALGLTLTEIRQLLVLPHADAAAERDRLRHSVAHKIAETRSRIVELEALERELDLLYVRLLRIPGPECGHIGDCACWLPTQEEVNVMAEEVDCCGRQCCPECACVNGGPCDCADCPCDHG